MSFEGITDWFTGFRIPETYLLAVNARGKGRRRDNVHGHHARLSRAFSPLLPTLRTVPTPYVQRAYGKVSRYLGPIVLRWYLQIQLQEDFR
jgi:hypothetical protein